MTKIRRYLPLTLLSLAVLAAATLAQPPGGPPPDGDGPGKGGPPFDKGGPPFGKGGPGGPGGMGQHRKLVAQFDKDGDGRLNAEERKAARDSMKGQGERRGPFGKGGPGGFMGKSSEPTKPGPKVSPSEVPAITGKPLYDPTTVRTLFLTFPNDDWEEEIAAFYHSDVEVPATLVVDGQTYRDVGVHFRGASSFFTVRPGQKRSLNLSMDFVNSKQRLLGSKTLNLLNMHEDPSLLSTILYSHIARNYLPTPKANFVKVVINGESWGVYTNVQQFNKEFLAENFGSSKGDRWKVPGRPGANSGLAFTGDDPERYKRQYEIKSADTPEAWAALVNVCKTLNQTPAEQLPAAIEPLLDVDGALRFLALDCALINCDGYWVRASDYSLFRDASGKFHVIPHDMNECFRPAEGPGVGGPFSRSPGVKLDPLIGLEDRTKPLRMKLLAVPAYRETYLQYVKAIATDWLDWNKLGPVVKMYRERIEPEVAADTRKLSSLGEFQRATADALPTEGGRRREMSLRQFAEERRTYLLEHPAIKALP